MTTTVVLDASAAVALLTDGGSTGDWVAATVRGAALVAPALAQFEAANILRRQLLLGALDETEAALAHYDLLELPIEYWVYHVLAGRIWELRANVTVYDASYVALAERLDAPVVTLDAKLAGASGPRCPVSHPSANGE